MSGKLEEELKRFHNPNSEKSRKLFQDYLEIDVISGWKWQQFEPPVARKTLDELIAKRGDAVHRSKLVRNGPPAPSLIKRDELEKAIRFLRGLVEARSNRQNVA
ncbi:HEPN domain-containing protein [Variovorax guangxiensis]|uniref:HEPN domain-containing protein n=1 Tax=Variovorax guangxiensis TaxID=1775474 RepID=UPI00285B2F84|nr:HEPN domain-containing protein [Variovorax guangxiensis]MDR6857856.1 hypothetical protein [Variovorax guangxiensis]